MANQKLGTGSGGAGLPSVVESTVGITAANLQAAEHGTNGPASGPGNAPRSTAVVDAPTVDDWRD